MTSDTGEYVAGAYFQLVLCCDLVTYNTRPSKGGRDGQAEFDVLGFDFSNQTVYLGEVATHLDGLNYGGRSQSETLRKVIDKYARQRAYAEENLAGFPYRRYQFWSPYVPKGYLSEGLAQIQGLELVINDHYTARVDELRAIARKTTKDPGNPFFRSLQILEALR